MRLTDILLFVAIQQEIPLGKARSVNSREPFSTARETFDEIVNSLEKSIFDFQQTFFKNENNTKNDIESNFTLSEDKSEQNDGNVTEWSIGYVKNHKDDVKNFHRNEVKLEDIRWNQSKLRGTDVWVFVPYFTLFQSANQVNIMFLKFFLYIG